MSKILFTGGKLRGLASGGVSRPITRGKVEGSGWGGSPGLHPGGEVKGSGQGGLQAHTRGEGLQGAVQAQAWGVSQHALRQTPPSRWLLLRAVHILLECILVITVSANKVAGR